MLSVVILTYNSVNFIKPCLDSVFTQGSYDHEVIVVDNGSKDATVSLIKENYPQVILIENKENLGACRGRNLGIKASGGEWVLTLDSDVILNNNFFFQFKKSIENLSPKVGAVQSKILQAGSRKIYSNGIYLSFLRRFFDINRGEIDNGQFNLAGDVFGACSAAALYNRRMLEDVKESTGYFDERFFFLVEDVDLAWRARKKGWRVLFYPELVCYHYGNSSNTNKKNRQYLSFRNRNLLIVKNENPVLIFLKLPLYLIYDLPRFLMILSLYKKVKDAW